MKKFILSLAVGLFSMLLSNVVCAEIEIVFGTLELGGLMDYDECPKTGRSYSPRTENICYEKLSSTKTNSYNEAVDGSVMIRFPFSSKPSIVSGGVVVGQMIEGRLEGLGFNTRGIHNQDEVIAALISRFGSPSSYKKRMAQNNAGASFEVFDAVWSTANLVITYQSATRTFDVGLVNINTQIGQAAQDAALKHLSRDKRPL